MLKYYHNNTGRSALWVILSIMIYVALVIYAITGVVFYFKKRIPCNKNKVFGILVGDSALSTVLDILSVFSTGEWGIGLKIFFHTAYYFTHNLIPFLFVIYILFS